MINTIKIRCINCHKISALDISKKHKNCDTLTIDRLPCCSILYEIPYKPEQPKVTLDEIERRLAAEENFTIKFKTPFTIAGVGEIHKLQASYQSWGDGNNFEIVHRVKTVLDRIEAGAEGWAVEFMEGDE